MKKKRSSKSAASGDATWGARPTNGVWGTAANWDPAVVPTDTATFGASSQAGIVFSAGSSATVNEIAFTSGAPAFTFTFTAPAPTTPTLTIAGAGVSNGSVSPQSFVVASSAQKYQQAQLEFTNAASAGGANVAYAVGPANPEAAGGGVIGFYKTSTAGSASFTITTGAGTPPSETKAKTKTKTKTKAKKQEDESTVGGEVSFSDSSSAGTARFTVHGSTSTTDGDTFGNAVFHDESTAANASFTNTGGTVAGGDGGNTQFYDSATAGYGLFHNFGGTVSTSNGGDVAFDGTSSAANGQYHNHASTGSGGYGGVTSFNNNAPDVSTTQGASAGNGRFYNYGATATGQGGGHTFFTAKYGSPSAAKGTFVNYGSAVTGGSSSAGHTVFSISLPQEAAYRPDAGNGVFWNFPGTVSGTAGGYTQFTVYADSGASITGSQGPTAGSATFINVGGIGADAAGGQTEFAETSSAASAQLIAWGGVNGGWGGTIVFYDEASGGAATVRLFGNGTLDISYYKGPTLTIGDLELAPGNIKTTVGTATPCLAVSGNLTIASTPAAFYFYGGAGVAAKTPYTLLTAPNLSSFTAQQFTGNTLPQGAPTFTIAGDELQVSFSPAPRAAGGKAKKKSRR